MASKRMFSKEIITSDQFIELNHSSQSLYFQLCLSADDEGFSSSIRSLMRVLKCTQKHLELLEEKGFIINFDTGIIAIKHWYSHNSINKNRQKQTKYTEEKNKLTVINDEYELINESKIKNDDSTYHDNIDQLVFDSGETSVDCKQMSEEYEQMSEKCQGMSDQISIDNSSIEKISIGNSSIDTTIHDKNKNRLNFGLHKNVLLSLDEYEQIKKLNSEKYIDEVSNYMETNRMSYKNHYKAIISWSNNDKGEGKKNHEKNKRDKFNVKPAITIE